MTMRITTESTARHNELDPMGALRRAWTWYMAFLFLPIVLLTLTSWFRLYDAGGVISAVHAREGFVATMIWIGVTGPLGFLGQEYYFSRYFKGESVSPKDYLKGKLIVWSCLMSGVIVATVLIYLTQAYFPHVFAIAVIYPFMLTQYPHGRAMVYHHGDKDQPSLYAEPK